MKIDNKIVVFKEKFNFFEFLSFIQDRKQFGNEGDIIVMVRGFDIVVLLL